MLCSYRIVAVCGILLLAPAVSHAQTQSIELGFDGALSVFLNDPTTTRTSIPSEVFRVGFFPVNRVSIEPSIALSYIDGQNRDPLVSVSLSLSALWHLTPSRSRTQPFLRPTAGVDYYSFGSTSHSRLKAGGYVGLKIPVANHLSVRLESGYQRGFESEDLPSSDEVSVNLGISLFVP